MHSSKKYHKNIDRIATAYMRLRIRPTQSELRAYNTTRRVLLSFDDYADEKRIDSLLEILKNYKVKAIFFAVGKWAEENPGIIDKIINDGHWLGNHTFSHANLKQLTKEQIANELERNRTNIKLLRPPQGLYDSRVRKIANNLGYKIAFWSIDTKDWRGINSETILERTVPNLQPGSCILLHMGGGTHG